MTTDKVGTVGDGTESDYGSDFGTDDEAALSVLVTQTESQVTTALIDHSEATTPNTGASPLALARGHRRKYVDEDGIVFEMVSRDGPIGEASIEVEYDEFNRKCFSPSRQDETRLSVPGREPRRGPEQPSLQEGSSPIERFRTPPKKPFSVTDIISPAWCELQYWYSLTKYGRVRRTAAMKQGSSVHKVLEEQASTVLPVDDVKPLVERILKDELKTIIPAEVIQQFVQKMLETEKRLAVPLDVIGGLVHQVMEKEKLAPIAVNTVSESIHKAIGAQVQKAVSVDVVTKEDAFGLRIWNIIQSLRTLRATGMTRELEVWAVIEGQVVNGVIDELSYDCPDEDLEAESAQRKEQKISGGRGGRTKKQKTVPEGQTNLDTFFGASSKLHSVDSQWLGTLHPIRKIYISDVKTRQSSTMPKGEASFRSTSMQLMMYHRMVSLLASNSVPADQIFSRYNLDADATYSDEFIAQMGSLEFDFRGQEDLEESGAPFESGQNAIEELLAHNTLGKLWSLMIVEFQRTMPSSSSQSLLGDVLRAEFRASGSGSVIGSKTFVYDSEVLDAYIKKTMEWWKGERLPKGVDIEEAFKCRFCEFAEVCTWRKDKVEESVQKARLRNSQRKKSDV